MRDAVWAGIARHGRPIQYAHLQRPLALSDACVALPVAFEPLPAGFVLDWRLLQRLHERRIGFATRAHAAGISSTGDVALATRVLCDEPYRLPHARIR